MCGINDYGGFTNDLKGCINDANDWATVLEYAGFQVEKILDADATKRNILDTFDHLITNATAGDEIVFTYSGHGTSMADKSGDEIDGYDEALVARDGTLLDDELRDILQKAKADKHVVVIADSCFSGTVTRAARSEMAVPRYVNIEDIPSDVPRKRKFLSDVDMIEILISGSTDSEYSYDAKINGRWNGAMTTYAVSVMRAGQTYNEFYEKLRELLPSDDYPQTPQLEGTESNKARIVFAEHTEPLPRPEPVVTGGFWAWVKKFWWILLVVLIVSYLLRRIF